MANVCCSIELEPKTLNHGQINFVREMAAEVVQRLEPAEASTILIEGLQVVERIKERDEKGQMIEGPCLCSCNSSANTDSPDPINLILKEPLSAPF